VLYRLDIILDHTLTLGLYDLHSRILGLFEMRKLWMYLFTLYTRNELVNLTQT